MIVGISGPIHAGKDTIGNALARELGVQKLGFSDAIIMEVARDYRATLEAYVRSVFSAGLLERLGVEALIRRVLVEERTPVTRAFLQDHGTRRRAEDADHWIRYVERPLRLERAGIVTGVRYPAEAKMIRRLGGHLIRVERPGHRDGADGHPVERGLEGWSDYDVILINDGTVAELDAKVCAWLATRRRA